MKRLSYGRSLALMPVIVAGGLIGCVEPNYRNEVTSDGQAHVKVEHVAKDPVPVRAVSAAPTTSDGATSVVPQTGTVDQRIDALEEQSRRLNEEITKLKLQRAAETK
jgi:hypothetical protein